MHVDAFPGTDLIEMMPGKLTGRWIQLIPVSGVSSDLSIFDLTGEIQGLVCLGTEFQARLCQNGRMCPKMGKHPQFKAAVHPVHEQHFQVRN